MPPRLKRRSAFKRRDLVTELKRLGGRELLALYAALPDGPAGQFAGPFERAVKIHLRLFGAGSGGRGHIVAALPCTPDIELVGSTGEIIDLAIGCKVAGGGNARCRTQNATNGNGKETLHFSTRFRLASARIQALRDAVNIRSTIQRVKKIADGR